MKLGTENKKKTMWAAVLGAVALLLAIYEFSSMLSGPTSTPLAGAPLPAVTSTRSGTRPGSKPDKRAVANDTLDPTLQLELLAASEETKYEGAGRNIFVSQAEKVDIPAPKSTGIAVVEAPKVWVPPPVPAPPPIPLKFFGFASKPGEPKKIFLSKDVDVFIAGEGEIIDRRYKVIRITPTSVEVQDLVNSGPPQNIPLTQNL